MSFPNPQLVLQNRIARLEPLEISHTEELLPVALHESLWRFTSVQITDHASLSRYIHQALEDKQRGVALPFIIRSAATGEAVGCTRFGNYEPAHQRVEIGWTWLSPALHGTGFNRYCKALLLDYAFDTLLLNRVELKTSARNLISQRAMEKIGATKEGILRRHMVQENGEIRDTVYYSFIKEEWPMIKAQKFAAVD